MENRPSFWAGRRSTPWIDTLAECAHLAICAMAGNARLGRASRGLQEKNPLVCMSSQSVQQHQRNKRGFKESGLNLGIHNPPSAKCHQMLAHPTSTTRSTNRSTWTGIKARILGAVWIRFQNWLAPTSLPSPIPPKLQLTNPQQLQAQKTNHCSPQTSRMCLYNLFNVGDASEGLKENGLNLSVRVHLLQTAISMTTIFLRGIAIIRISNYGSCCSPNI